MCINMCIKNPSSSETPAKPKIDLVLESMLQQRSFYPLYPGSLTTPVEVEQFRGLMMESTPDILITPSDLMLFTKNINGCICVNPGTLFKSATAGNYAIITVDPLVTHHEEAAQDNLFSNRSGDRVRVDILNI
jgi:DNA polymerase alpha subunit B